MMVRASETAALPAATTADQRLIVADDDTLVWKLQRSTFQRVSIFGITATVINCAIIGAALWWLTAGRIGVLGAALIGGLLAILSAVTFLREGTLVALRASDEIFIEWRTLIRWRQRFPIARLSEVTSYDVRSFIDADGDVVAHEVYELALIAGSRKPICYTADETTAKAVGEHILFLRPQPR